MSDNNTLISLSFGLYLLLLLGTGIWAWSRTASLSDYILGGRRLGYWITAFSASASDMSGWLLLGLPGYAYASGLEAFWIAIGLLVGTWLNWRLVAERLRRYSHHLQDAITLPDFLEKRFRDQSRLLRLISAVFILLFFTFYASSGLVAGGKLFNTVFAVPYDTAVLIGVAVIVAYTFMGGFLAVSWTDMVQGLMMLGALVVVPVVVLIELGGWGAANATLNESNPQLLDAMTSSSGEELGLISLLSLLGWGLGYFGQPHILARFMAIRDPMQLVYARRVSTSWVAITLTGAVLVGITGVAYLQPELAGADTEKVFMQMVDALFHPLLAGILLAAILAAIMSTADSQLLVASSALAEDFYRTLWRRRATDRELVWVGRLAVVVIAGFATALAMNPDNKVLDLVAYAWAGFGAAFGPTLMLALYWKNMTRNGALAGIIAGGVTVIVWKQLQGGVFDLYEIIPGIVISTLAIVLVSRAGAEVGQEIRAELMQVEQQMKNDRGQ